jgi:thiopeptide-type bacteriocin biosynthesis protein
LRLHGDPKRLSAEALPELHACLLGFQQKGALWRMQLDTYQREMERYGGLAGMRVSERFFRYDSELVLELLAAVFGQAGSQLRWLMAFAAVDRLLGSLGFDLNSRRLLVNAMGQAREKTFRVGDAYRKQVSEKFRKHRQILERLVADACPADLPDSVNSALSRFNAQMEGIRMELQHAQQAGALTKPLEDLAASYVHMHLNRIFRAAANAQEMVLYDFLARTYDSMAAKKRGR